MLYDVRYQELERLSFFLYQYVFAWSLGGVSGLRHFSVLCDVFFSNFQPIENWRFWVEGLEDLHILGVQKKDWATYTFLFFCTISASYGVLEISGT